MYVQTYYLYIPLVEHIEHCLTYRFVSPEDFLHCKVFDDRVYVSFKHLCINLGHLLQRREDGGQQRVLQTEAADQLLQVGQEDTGSRTT